MAAGESKEIDLYLRATTFTQKEVVFTVFYKSGGVWRVRALYLNTDI